MSRVKAIIEKDLRYNSLFVEIVYLCLCIGYGVMFGLLSRTIGEEVFYFFRHLIPLALSIICASVVVINLSYDQKNKTGEMILTTGISIREYILAKVLDGMIVSFVGLLLFQITFIVITYSKFKNIGNIYYVFSNILFVLAANLLYACCGVIFKLKRIKWILATVAGIFLVPIASFFLYYRPGVSSYSILFIFRRTSLVVIGLLIVNWAVVLLVSTKYLNIYSFSKK